MDHLKVRKSFMVHREIKDTPLGNKTGKSIMNTMVTMFIIDSHRNSMQNRDNLVSIATQ